MGMLLNTKRTPIELSESVLTQTEVDTQMEYTAQQRLDGYAQTVEHALRRKAAFDKRVTKGKGEQPLELAKGDLAQVYRNDLATTVSNERKLTPKWSEPRRVTATYLNSYSLETPRSGTELAGKEEEKQQERKLGRERGVEREGEDEGGELEQSSEDRGDEATRTPP